MDIIFNMINDIHALTQDLFSLVKGREIVTVCIGTDLVGGDCFGPLVGQLLIEAGAPVYVYGTLDRPITALNVNAVGAFVRLKHPCAAIVAIDSCVGADKGKIKLRAGPLLPGAAGGKTLDAVGDISLTAITSCHLPDKKGFMLTGLGFVYPLARIAASVVCNHSKTTENRFRQDKFYNKSNYFAINTHAYVH